jgi:hypothetical protein
MREMGRWIDGGKEEEEAGQARWRRRWRGKREDEEGFLFVSAFCVRL